MMLVMISLWWWNVLVLNVDNGILTQCWKLPAIKVRFNILRLHFPCHTNFSTTSMYNPCHLIQVTKRIPKTFLRKNTITILTTIKSHLPYLSRLQNCLMFPFILNRFINILFCLTMSLCNILKYNIPCYLNSSIWISVLVEY